MRPNGQVCFMESQILCAGLQAWTKASSLTWWKGLCSIGRGGKWKGGSMGWGQANGQVCLMESVGLQAWTKASSLTWWKGMHPIRRGGQQGYSWVAGGLTPQSEAQLPLSPPPWHFVQTGIYGELPFWVLVNPPEPPWWERKRKGEQGKNYWGWYLTVHGNYVRLSSNLNQLHN